jgi:hypothetical protein
VDPANAPQRKPQATRPIVVNDNAGQTLMFEPRGPKRRVDTHWEQNPDAAPDQTMVVSSPARRAPGRPVDANQMQLGSPSRAPPASHANLEGHRFFSRDAEGNWVKNTRQSVPEPILRIRRHNESSLDLTLSKPTERYAQQAVGPRTPQQPGYLQERKLNPDLHQKGIQAFRNRRWFHEGDSPAGISPRVRLGTANKPQGFQLPNYEHLPPNSPVTRPSARKVRESLQYPEQRQSNDESRDMFNGLPNPRVTNDPFAKQSQYSQNNAYGQRNR